MSDQQMNSGTPRYPVDRYLVERSNKLEMVNITDDIWNAEPALRPEDEIVLRKLHDMLQSTADDLKLLSGELSKYHEPGVQVKSLPTPLDEDFNEKVHIEELVNAKFHGYNIVDKSQPTSTNTQRENINRIIKSVPAGEQKSKKVIDAGIQVNQIQIHRKPTSKTNLAVSRTKIVEINENINVPSNANNENSKQHKEKINKPTVAYRELSFKYTDPKLTVNSSKPLQVQNMPSINIRGELKEQKVLHLNIEPEVIGDDQNDVMTNNIAVISVRHGPVIVPKTVPVTNINQVQYPSVPNATYNKEPIRKFSKMSSCESSEVDSHNKVKLVPHGFRKTRPYRATKMVNKLPSKQHTENVKTKGKNEFTRHCNSNLEIWKKKLNAVYGCSTSSRKSKLVNSDNKAQKITTKTSLPSCSRLKENLNTLNNAEYIPYSKLTLGGARVSDIEKELTGIPNRTDITLEPILSKLISRENSFSSPREDVGAGSPKILTTSDENLLKEVLDIERKVTKTLTTNLIESNASYSRDKISNDIEAQESYADDFEDDKSDYSAPSEKLHKLIDEAESDENYSNKSSGSDNDNRSYKIRDRMKNEQNKTFTKTPNLAFKKNVDVFEFVHNRDTQDTGTQSNTTQKISPKETQTSPINDKSIVQPIHNDLWPSIDPKDEVQKLFQLEKDFIKKLIVDEYGDLMVKNLNKPSTSKGGILNQNREQKNVTASQKNTQTSPAHVKSVMTSPTRTKTRTTSPFALSLTVDQHTSPMNEELKVVVEDGDDLALSINLSSPRFSLRLPQTSREVLSNLESHAVSNSYVTKNYSRKIKPSRKNPVTSSSSGDGDYSSSDISSLGEIRFKLKRFQKLQVPTLSELSSSPSVSKCSLDVSDCIMPLRSEGEVSLGQVNKKRSNNNIKSEGEASLGHLC